MELKKIINQADWDSRLLAVDRRASFLQSWQWGQALIESGQKVDRLAIVSDQAIIACAQIVYKPLPFGLTYAFCPKGPVVNEDLRLKNEDWLKVLIEYLKSKNCVFLRLEPTRRLQVLGYRLHAVRDINPPSTLLLDLTKSEDELLFGMHSKTRYNLRLAQKHSLRLSVEKKFEDFWHLLKKTGARDGFPLHPQKNYRAVLNLPEVHQVTLYDGAAPAATGCFFVWNGVAAYLYGASDHARRALMAPYLIQWEGVKLGKKLGCVQYDFFGIAPPMRDKGQGTRGDEMRKRSESAEVGTVNYVYDTAHRYAGVTRFKLGFGGAPAHTPGTFDLIISPKRYMMYRLLRWVRRKI